MFSCKKHNKKCLSQSLAWINLRFGHIAAYSGMKNPFSRATKHPDVFPPRKLNWWPKNGKYVIKIFVRQCWCGNYTDILRVVVGGLRVTKTPHPCTLAPQCGPPIKLFIFGFILSTRRCSQTYILYHEPKRLLQCMSNWYQSSFLSFPVCWNDLERKSRQ